MEITYKDLKILSCLYRECDMDKPLKGEAIKWIKEEMKEEPESNKYNILKEIWNITDKDIK